ncbi:MAG TPA: FxSxx-COOH system tetratricopeptide repeat protein [Ktedonosporobacter sp.]|nr:FxSxx-COOH system tetratricopeptide repeat protein [Ktedonosporobacter sp.]
MVKKAAQATPNDLLRRARKERGWTQQQVADLIGARVPLNITRWERGTAFPSAYYVQKLSLLFGKTPRELGLLAPGEEREEKPSSEMVRFWSVPYRRNLFFTGREELLLMLEQTLLDKGNVALTQSYALCGLGGIGKTQLALEYAYRSREQYQAVFWVRAASLATLSTDLGALAHLLALPEHESAEQQIVIEAVRGWFSRNQGWLLILDNADDLTLLKDFVPTAGHGHLLLTTRAQATGKLAISVEVEKMDLEEGILLLLHRAKLLAAGTSLAQVQDPMLLQARHLVQALDGLPLAIDQAAAYIEESGCSLEEYLQLYEERRMDLLKRASAALPDYPETVASTWSLSFQQVEQANEAAAHLLRLCAFLDADAIPEMMLREGASWLGLVLGPAATDRLRWNEVLRVLRQYSLIRRHSEKGLLQIHRLVQVVIQAGMNEQTRRIWAERAMQVVNAALPEVSFENWGRCQELLPHAQRCSVLIEEYHLASEAAFRLLHQTGWYLRERGSYAQAERCFQQALLLGEQALEFEHPSYRDCLHDLALLYWDRGDYERAEPLLLRLLTFFERSLGTRHAKMAACLNHLGLLYWSQGKYEQAEPLLQQALASHEQLLGPKHPDVAHTLNNLANLFSYQGKYEQAEPLLQRSLAIFEQTVGPDDPAIAFTLHNLGWVYHCQGVYEQAEPLYQRALTIRERALGSDHPDTVFTLNNLARLTQEQGQLEQARLLFLRALEIRERVLGPEHPDLATTLNYLAELYHAQGQFEQAGPLYQRALTIREQKLGPEHPRTAFTLDGLARFHQDQGDAEEAARLYQQAFSIRERKLGAEHPETAATRERYARLLREMGRKKASFSSF